MRYPRSIAEAPVAARMQGATPTAGFGSVAVLIVLLWVSAPAAQSAAPAERPIYHVGQRWVLDRGEYELREITKDAYIFTAAPGQEIHLTKDLAIRKIVANGMPTFEIDAPQVLKWPLKVGEWGLTRTDLHSPDVPTEPGHPIVTTTGGPTLVWRVESYEDVTIPAGSVKAFRITYAWSMMNTSIARATFALWYAPGVRQIVKARSALEALNFELSALPESEPLTAARAHEVHDAVAAAPSTSLTTSSPRIVISAPADHARVSEGHVRLSGRVSAESGVAVILVTLNGTEVFRHGLGSHAVRGVAIVVGLDLRDGLNDLVVSATDRSGQSQKVVRSLELVGR